MSWTYQSWGTEYPRIAVDLTGNHAADILGFGYDGVWVSLNDGNGNFSPPNIGITDFCIATGWSIEKHVRMVANLTDSGYPDIIGFGNAGVYVSKGNGDGTFLPVELVVANFGYDQAWRVEEHPRYVVDLNGNGKADIIGFGNDGVWTAMNKGDGTFYPAQYILADFGVNQGWRVEKHLRYLADLDGDGKPEIIGIGDAGVYVAMNKGDGTFYPVKMGLVGLGYNQGWRVNKHLRLVGDILGIGKASIVAAREDGEVLVAWGIGNGTFQIPRAAGFSLGYLFKDFQYYGQIDDYSSYLIFLADIIGNGKRKQLIAFGDTGVLTIDFTNPSSPFPGSTDFGINQGWDIHKHIRTVANIGGGGKPGIVGFGDAGIYTAVSKGDNTFSDPATFVLADFGLFSGRVVNSITVDFKMTGDNLDDETQLHIFVKNRKSDTSDSGDPGSLAQHIQNFADAENNWFEKNSYLGWALSANVGGGFGDGDNKRVNILLRKKPIPIEELNLPQIIIFIIPSGDDTWKFEYIVAITLDDGTQLQPFGSNTNGITGIIMDQDNPSYSGIGTELNPQRQPPQPPGQYKGPILSRATIEFKTHNNDKSSTTAVNVHVVNRKSGTVSQDISVVSDIATNQYFDDPSDHIYELPIAANNIYLGDIVLPVVNINIIPFDDDETWIFDYIVTLYFGNTDPYTWVTSGVILDNGHHKHMGVYSGRRIINNPQASLTLSPIVRNKTISLTYLNQKLNEFLLSRQLAGSPDPLIKIRINNTTDLIKSLGFTFRSNDDYAAPRSYSDIQHIDNAPPAPNIILRPNDIMGFDFSHSMTDLPTFINKYHTGSFTQEQVNDINLKSLSLPIDTGNLQTPLNLGIDFETDWPVEVTGAANIDITKLSISAKLTLRPDTDNGVVDLMGWLQDISKIQVTMTSPLNYNYKGTFLGNPISGKIGAGGGFASYDDLVQSLINQVYIPDINQDVSLSPLAVVVALIIGAIAAVLGGLLLGPIGAITSLSLVPILSIDKLKSYIGDKLSGEAQNGFLGARDALNSLASQVLMGGVVNGANPGPLPYPNPCRLTGMGLNNGLLTLDYIGPENNFQFPVPCKADWPGVPLDPGTLTNIEHIIVLTMENRSFDHMLGYLSLPYDKGGMKRTDVDGLKGGEFNIYNGRTIRSFRLPYGDTIFSPGPNNSFESTATAMNGGSMDGFVQAHADSYGNTMAHRVMGYHSYDNVPTYDALAREFAICNRWFCSFPGETFPNRFFQLTGRPNIDPWGMWDYYTDSPLPFIFTDSIFDHLSKQGVSWRYFEHSPCQLRLFERYTFDSEHVVSFNDPEFGFANLALSGALPSVSFIDPHFKDFPPGGFCDEPPSDIRNSQKFIEDLVGFVRASPNWEKTLLIITYDEHGGFYDHVPPPNAAQVSPELPKTTGLRVPTFVISPWIKRGSVFGHDSTVISPPISENELASPPIFNDSLHFDHTSILKTIARRFLSQNPPYMGARYAAAHDLSEVLSAEIEKSTDQFLPFVPYTLDYENMKKNLDVPGGDQGDRSLHALLRTSTANALNIPESQKFRFEDAEDGLVYIRTFAGLFVTVVYSGRPVNYLPGTVPVYQVEQNLKFPPVEQNLISPFGLGSRDPNLQKWKFVPGNNVLAFNTGFVVYSAAFPNLVLQVDKGAVGAALTSVILSIPTPPTSSFAKPNQWKVTSPLLPNNAVVE
jgi:phospholipase C